MMKRNAKELRENVTFAVCHAYVMHEALAESSYLAQAIAPAKHDANEVWHLLLTDDEAQFVRRAMAEAYAAIVAQ